MKNRQVHTKVRDDNLWFMGIKQSRGRYQAMAASLCCSVLLFGSGLLLSFEAHATGTSSPIVQVNPCNKSNNCDDATRIENALKSLSPSIGGTVQLSAGKFYINRPVFTTGFNGVLEGKGQGQTIITGVGSFANPFGKVTGLPPYSIGGDDSSAYFVFLDPKTSLTIRKMTLKVPEPSNSADITTYFATQPTSIGGPGLLSNFIDIRFISNQADTTIEKLDLIGSKLDPATGFFDSFANYQPVYGVVVIGYHTDDNVSNLTTRGRHTIRNTYFNGIMIQNVLYHSFVDASIDIMDNVWTNMKSFNLNYFAGSTVNVSRNLMSGTQLPTVSIGSSNDHTPGGPNIVNVIENIVTTDVQGLEIGGRAPSSDPGFAYTKLNIKRNIIHAADAIGINVFKASNAEIKCNIIIGNGESGISLGGVSNSLIQSNNLSLYTSSGDYTLSDYPVCPVNNQIVMFPGSTINDVLCPGLNTITQSYQLDCS